MITSNHPELRAIHSSSRRRPSASFNKAVIAFALAP
jgi:hypothetical protein